MKFVDEVHITVKAGNGGSGSASFRREKFIQYGGPDGGDGGKGGDMILQGDQGLNTLVDFRHKKRFDAQNGESGRGRQMYGKGGDDFIIRVPTGTEVYDLETDQKLGDITEQGQQLVIADGGKGGLGNMHFKSSTNRAPKRFTSGEPGDLREIKLELKVLADVGLLGFPNAGKSTFVNAISAANPKIADYPFTTLYPALGVVPIDSDTSFVVADIPGIIEGAAEGAGLGVQFLKHLSRTSLLLHLVDVAPIDESDPVESVRIIENELKKYSDELGLRERWLILNKIDLVPEDEREAHCQKIIDGLDWQGPVFQISAATSMGTKDLGYKIMQYMDEQSMEAEPSSHA